MSRATTKAVGSSHRRGDARLFVGGRGTYIDDVAVPGVLHVAFLRSPHAHASIVAIRTAGADALPGVVRVVTAADLAPVCKGWQTSQTYPGLVMRTQYPLAEDRVVFVGQAVVAVVAESRALAEDAVELIEVDWALLPPACDLAGALAPDAARAHPDVAGNLAYQADVGDAEDAALFANAACVVEASFRFNRQTVMPMETRGVVASYLPGDGSLTVHQSHTAPHQLRSLYATHLGLDEGRIRVICPHVGGSFGAKIHLYSDEVATVAISRLIAPRDRARLLDIGADDVITLPIDGSELAARLRAVVRRSGGFTRSVLRAGAVELHMDSRLATTHGRELHLSPTEYRVLELLILRKNTLVTKSAVMDSLYGDIDEPEIKSIDVLMHRLRKRLGASGVGALVTTVWGAGYIVRETVIAEPAIDRPFMQSSAAMVH